MDSDHDIHESTSRARSILVVSDKDLNEKLFGHLLRHEWDIEFVMSNEEAFQAIQRRPFDLVVTAEDTSTIEDIHLLQRIRSFHPHTRMIILTRRSGMEDVILALREHAFSYFSSPFTFESLEEMIHMAMEQPCWDDGIEVASATSAWVRLLVRCDQGTADRLMQFFIEMAEIPEEEKGKVAYALREMLMNAMKYGAGFDPGQYVEVSYLRTQQAVACRVKDPGEGFKLEDLLHAAIANPPENPIRHMSVREKAGLPPGGYGILLSRHLVDDLVYNEKGNEVLLIKYLNDVTPSLNRVELNLSN